MGCEYNLIASHSFYSLTSSFWSSMIVGEKITSQSMCTFSPLPSSPLNEDSASSGIEFVWYWIHICEPEHEKQEFEQTQPIFFGIKVVRDWYDGWKFLHLQSDAVGIGIVAVFQLLEECDFAHVRVRHVGCFHVQRAGRGEILWLWIRHKMYQFHSTYSINHSPRKQIYHSLAASVCYIADNSIIQFNVGAHNYITIMAMSNKEPKNATET